MTITNCAGGRQFFLSQRRGKSEYEGTVCACDMNETNHGDNQGLTTSSL